MEDEEEEGRGEKPKLFFAGFEPEGIIKIIVWRCPRSGVKCVDLSEWAEKEDINC